MRRCATCLRIIRFDNTKRKSYDIECPTGGNCHELLESNEETNDGKTENDDQGSQDEDSPDTGSDDMDSNIDVDNPDYYADKDRGE